MAKRGVIKPIVVVLIAGLLNLSLPPPWAQAAMVGTEAVIGTLEPADAERARLRALLLREEARAQLESYGITQDEALARIDGLSDREVAQIAGKLDALPAGGTGDPYAAAAAVLLLAAIAVVALIALLIAAIVEAVSEGGDES